MEQMQTVTFTCEDAVVDAIRSGAVLFWRSLAYRVALDSDDLPVIRPTTGTGGEPFQLSYHGGDLLTCDTHLCVESINSIGEARAWLEDLHKRGLLFSPESDAVDGLDVDLPAETFAALDSTMDLVINAADRYGFDAATLAESVGRSPTVNSEEEARAFLNDLHTRGLLFHPEDSAPDCLTGRVGAGELADIEQCRLSMWYAADRDGFDPCALALEALNWEADQ